MASTATGMFRSLGVALVWASAFANSASAAPAAATAMAHRAHAPIDHPPATLLTQSTGERLRGLFRIRPATGGSPTETDADAGIRALLTQGVEQAVSRLGRDDGFLADQAVRIATPKPLRRIARTARKLGAGAQVDAFETSMNRAAEQAVPAAADILTSAIRAMSLSDALAIVRGGDTAGTDYFRRGNEDRLRDAFLPIVRRSLSANRSAQALRDMGGELGALGTMAGLGGDFDLDRYVTDKALDGLFHYIGEEEKAIRADPLGRGSDLLRRVFGG